MSDQPEWCEYGNCRGSDRHEPECEYCHYLYQHREIREGECVCNLLVRANEGYADEVERVRNDAHRAIVAILEAVGGTVIVPRNVLESIDYNTVVSMYERPLSRDVVWTTKEGSA